MPRNTQLRAVALGYSFIAHTHGDNRFLDKQMIVLLWMHVLKLH
jgi:hypothetical protein